MMMGSTLRVNLLECTTDIDFPIGGDVLRSDFELVDGLGGEVLQLDNFVDAGVFVGLGGGLELLDGFVLHSNWNCT